MTLTLLTGPDPAVLGRRAFQRASAVAGDEPGSVVVAAADGGRGGAVADAWAAAHDPLRVRVTDLDGLAGDAHERARGPATRLDTPTRRQTIDRALRAVAAETGLAEAHAHEREVRELLSELAAAGYDDPAALAAHVDTHLDDRTVTVLTRVAETAARLREAAAPAAYTLPEAYRSVIDADDPAALVDADALVVVGYTDLTDTQTDLLACLAERTPTEVVVTLPLAATPDRERDNAADADDDDSGGDTPTTLRGANAYVADTYATLTTLAGEHVHVTDTGATQTSTDATTDTGATQTSTDATTDTGAAQTPPDDAPPTLAAAVGRTFTRTVTATDSVPPGSRWEAAPTPVAESRAVARRVRRQLADGAAPGDVLVVAPELLTYRGRLVDAFEEAGVPAVDAGRPPLGQTRVGRAAVDLVDCCLSTPTARDLANLASNPAVDLAAGCADGTARLDAGELLRLVSHLPTGSLDALRSELDAPAETVVTTLLDRVRAVREARPEETVARVRELFAHVGLTVAPDDRPDTDDPTEAGARTAVDRTLTAVARVRDPEAGELGDDGPHDDSPHADPTDSTHPLRRVADAFERVRVTATAERPGTVEIVGPQDALGRSYDHLHVVGLTRAAFPPADRRSRFFARAFETLPSVTATDRQARARYQFAVLVGAAETATLSHPEVGTDGDERLPSPVLTELARVTGLEPTDGDDAADGTPATPAVASAGDLQRALAGRDGDTRETALSRAETDGLVSEATAAAIRRGAACLAGRVGDGLGAYDGHVAPATVAAHHDPAAFSPTALRSYARCGFRYYADRVLGLPEEPEYPLEPTPLDRGTLVHDTLERFFGDLLAGSAGDHATGVHGTPVDLTAFDRDTLERRLLAAVETELADLDAPTGDAFGTRWLETLLAGLATPEANPHYGDDHPHEGPDRGVFVRFLDEELDDDDRVLAVESPLDFADGVGDVDDGSAQRDSDDPDPVSHAIDLEAPDGRTVAVRGRVDRVAVEIEGGGAEAEATGATDTVNIADATGADPLSISGLVHDYKTSDPTTKDTFEGIDFQLPIYTVAARRALARRYGDAFTGIDGGFYTVEPPATVRRKRTLLGTIYRYGGDAADFERFLDAEIPERVADVADSVADGAFHTTTLDADAAGCDYCRFADVCGVRHHRRRERATAADDAGHYVPQAARPTGYLDDLGGEES